MHWQAPSCFKIADRLWNWFLNWDSRCCWLISCVSLTWLADCLPNVCYWNRKNSANLSPPVALVPLAYLLCLSHLAVQLPDRFGRPVRPAASTAHAILLQMMWQPGNFLCFLELEMNWNDTTSFVFSRTRQKMTTSWNFKDVENLHIWFDIFLSDPSPIIGYACQ